MYKNIHELNVCVNKFSWVPHKNILTRKFCQVEITVHVLLIKWLLATYSYFFILLRKQLNALRPLYCLTPWNWRYRENYFQLITSCVMDVNAGHVNGYIWEAVVYVHIMWILYWSELGLRGLLMWWNTGSGPVGLGKLPSCKFHLKYLKNPNTINE